MNQKSLIDALSDCSNSCGWCTNHCPDEDKYEVLNTCLSIQNQFVELGRTTNKILADRSIEFIKNTFNFFEAFANELQQNHQGIIYKKSERETNREEVWKLPGCSQIFGVAQSLRDMYSNDSLRFESE